MRRTRGPSVDARSRRPTAPRVTLSVGWAESSLRIAPPFRTLHTRYPVENLAEAFAEGIVTGHPTMPQFRLDAAQIGDLLAYLKTLEH